ncbi:hypothetical protein SLEP1_g37190 [Rubroshorea leprosula]|uniref:Uncharacterized protein n=1 Tax=Rubroshorea leprosula TaxID=152421 RepID=A0AAV5KTT0_9ROSI|nr:hypothetical protein SLEP1_g37190 [Rubroshorea leprosula]
MFSFILRKAVEHFLKALEEVTLKDVSTIAQKLLSSPLTMASYGNGVSKSRIYILFLLLLMSSASSNSSKRDCFLVSKWVVVSTVVCNFVHLQFLGAISQQDEVVENESRRWLI